MGRKNEPSTWQAAGFAMGIGISFAVIIAVGILMGRLADAYFSCAPWGTLCGILLGFFAAGWSTYKRLVGKNGSGF